jgi:hypothetical protein
LKETYSCIEPREVWGKNEQLCLLQFQDMLNELRMELNEYCTSAACHEVPSVQPGTFVLVQYSADNEWYRGRVDAVSPDGARCNIFFVDYGNREDKPVDSLRVLPPKFSGVATQAIKCRMAEVTVPVLEEIDANFKSACTQTQVRNVLLFFQQKSEIVLAVSSCVVETAINPLPAHRV